MPEQDPLSFKAVREEELAEIKQRFEATGGADPPPGQTKVELEDRLVGLAISGGGIRSATFGLGVLQALKSLGILETLHYLSTVSGGGYIGSWLTANCARQPGWLGKDADWNDSVAHLRRYSNYLSPEVGFFSADSWSMFTVWLRNALLVQLTVVLATACVLTAPRLLIVLFDNWTSVGHWRWLSIVLFLLGVAGIAGNETRVTRRHPLKLLKDRAWLAGTVAAALLASLALWIGVRMHFEPFTDGPVRIAAAIPIALLLVVAAFLLQPAAVLIVGLFMRLVTKKDPPKEINYTQAWVQGVVVVPMMATGFFVAAILWHQSITVLHGVGFDSYSELFTSTALYWPFPLSIMFVSIWLLSISGVATLRTGGLSIALLAPLVCVPVLHALLCAIMLLHARWNGDPSAGLPRAFVFTPALVLFAFSLTIVMLIGMLGRRSTEGLREWWSRLGAWLAIYGTAWMIIAIAAVYGPEAVRWLFGHHSSSVSLATVATWIGTVAGGLFAGNSASTGGEQKSKKRLSLLDVVAMVAPFLFIAGTLLLVAFAVDQVVQLNANGTTWSSINSTQDSSSSFLKVSSIVLGGCLGALIIMAWRIDINEFSLNAFYRNRLVRCYLGASRFEPQADGTVIFHRRPQNFTGFDDRDDIPLADLAAKSLKRTAATTDLATVSKHETATPQTPGGANVETVTEGVTDSESLGLSEVVRGPLHLVNCSLNLGGSSDLALHTRHSASFTLSPLHCGSSYPARTMQSLYLSRPTQTSTSPSGPEVGYVPTKNYGGAVGAPTLGQAISVSGAAASPNMGYHTSPVVAFLLTVFNFRLGWWFPNPAKQAGIRNPVPSPRFNLSYLFAELFGLATDQGRFLMISDGGHFENLAVYELVKRRCAVIIVSDAECDPGLTFEGLGTLIRVCEVDFNTKIRIELESIRPAKESAAWSSRRCAVGTIEYPDGKRGVLVYLKAAMTGHEDTAVLQYKASHPAFPHESTGDQFYGEDQFESYRVLGYDVACRTFAAVSEAGDAGKTFVERASTLVDVWSPALAHIDRFTDQTARLMEIWKRIGADAAYSSLDPPAGGSPLGADRTLFYLCCEMIQLMENVYLDLNLDDMWDHPDNAGWRRKFTNWSESQAIRDTWSRAFSIFGTRFQFFCNRRLNLPLPPAAH
jgi:hypothetical protein